MQMRIRPTHNGLQGAMELVERNFPRHQNPPPNRRFGSDQGDFDDIDFHGRRARQSETANSKTTTKL
jgi:hypothetical protein